MNSRRAERRNKRARCRRMIAHEPPPICDVAPRLPSKSIRAFALNADRMPALLINLRLARRPRFPASVNPEPLVGIASHILLYHTRKQLSQASHILFFIARTIESKRPIHL